MLIGLAKEIKLGEHRVALSPGGVSEIIHHGHKVYVEKDAGAGVDISDQEYMKVGAEIVERAKLFAECEMIVKVKELQKAEYDIMRPEQILFSYLHLAPDLPQTEALLKNRVIGVAFETITGKDGSLPLLTPMSEVAGKMAVQQGSHFLTKLHGGSGVLLGGVPGAPKGNVLIIGGGVVGINAAKVAMGMGARVMILDKSLSRLRYLDDIFDSHLTTMYCTKNAIVEGLIRADMVIGGVLIPGDKAPKIVTREMLKLMKPGSALIDVAIDQGGCFETSRATTHFDPIYKVDDIIHYCVGNIPAGVAKTSSKALESAILPYVIIIADKGISNAAKEDTNILNGINVMKGKVTYKAIAAALGKEYTDPLKMM